MSGRAASSEPHRRGAGGSGAGGPERGGPADPTTASAPPLDRRLRLGGLATGLLACGLLVGCDLFDPGFGEIRTRDVRSARDRAAQHDAVAELRRTELLGSVLEEHGVDCWMVVDDAGRLDPLLPLLASAGTRPRSRFVLLHCRDPGRGGAVRAVAVGSGTRGEETFYDDAAAAGVAVADGSGEVAAAVRDRLRSFDAGVVAVDRSPDVPLADGLGASDAAWVDRVVEELDDVALVSAGELALDYVSRYLEVEAPLFREAARLTVSLLDSVLTAEVVRPGRSSPADLVWAVRQRVRDWGVELAEAPRVRIFRTPRSPDPDEPDYAATWFLPGDLIYVTADVRYLDYVVRAGRWAYVTRREEYDAPPPVRRAMAELADAVETSAGEVTPGATVGALESARTRGRLRIVPLGLVAPRTLSEGQRTGWRVRRGGFLALSMKTGRRVPGWGEELELRSLHPGVVGASGVELVGRPQRTPRIIE